MAPVAVSALQTRAFRPLLGHAVSLLLDVAAADRAPSIRRAALVALTKLLRSVGAGDVVGLFLPGIASALFKWTYQRPLHRGSAATVAALSAWATAICIALEDAPTLVPKPGANASVEALLALASGTSMERQAATSEAMPKDDGSISNGTSSLL